MTQFSVPIVGSRWVLEIDNDYSRELVEVMEITLNQTKSVVLVTVRTMCTGGAKESSTTHMGLSRFWKWATPVGNTLAEMSEYKNILEMRTQE